GVLGARGPRRDEAPAQQPRLGLPLGRDDREHLFGGRDVEAARPRLARDRHLEAFVEFLHAGGVGVAAAHEPEDRRRKRRCSLSAPATTAAWAVEREGGPSPGWGLPALSPYLKPRRTSPRCRAALRRLKDCASASWRHSALPRDQCRVAVMTSSSPVAAARQTAMVHVTTASQTARITVGSIWARS